MTTVNEIRTVTGYNRPSDTIAQNNQLPIFDHIIRDKIIPFCDPETVLTLKLTDHNMRRVVNGTRVQLLDVINSLDERGVDLIKVGGVVTSITTDSDERARIARASACVELLSGIAGARDIETLLALARNAYTPKEILLDLAQFPDYTIQIAVAYNRNASVEALDILAGIEDSPMQIAVASHRNTRETTLDSLAQSPIWRVRAAVAGNNRTQKVTLVKLKNDRDERVRKRAVNNSNTEETKPTLRLGSGWRATGIKTTESKAKNQANFFGMISRNATQIIATIHKHTFEFE